ncbi:MULTISPECIES: hypothetical protein [Achromobacter]|nr:hypothetical protein [Achromobacter xylosoxidans]
MQAAHSYSSASKGDTSHDRCAAKASDLSRPGQCGNAPVVGHEYMFDVRLFASIRVRATCPAEARKMLANSLDCETVTLGKWPDGSPIAAEVSADDDADLIQVDGIEVT